MFEEFFLFHDIILKAWEDRSIANYRSNDDHQFICQLVAGEQLRYNYEHKHSQLRFMTPHQRHTGQDIELLAQRKERIEAAKAANPSRWGTRDVRNCDPVAYFGDCDHLFRDNPITSVSHL